MRHYIHLAAQMLFLLLTATAATRGADPPAKPPVPQPKFTVVTVTSHCDWAWIRSRAMHEALYADAVRRYLAIQRAHPAYVWEMEDVCDELQPFLDKAGRDWPGLVDEFWRRMREGRIEVICGYANPRIDEVFPETFVRNLVLGKQYFRSRAPGLQQKVYNAVDLMCGHSQMPQLLNQAEYKYFMFQRPRGNATFWRRGLDGTRMLTTIGLSLARDPRVPPAQEGYGQPLHGLPIVPVWHVGIGMDDALPSPEVAKMAATWDPKTKVLSTLARFFEECEKYGDRLGTLEGPLDSNSYYTNAGFHGNRNIYTQNNINEDVLLTLEKTASMAGMLGREHFIEPIDNLWRDHLSCTTHAIEWIYEDDYRERMSLIERTRARALRATEETLAAISNSIQFTPQLGTPLVVFNVHAWPVTAAAQFQVDGDGRGLALCDESGRAVPLQRLVDDDARRRGSQSSQGSQGRQAMAFIARDLPACGYKTYYLSRKAATETAAASNDPRRVIENEYYRVESLPDGAQRIVDKLSGRVLGDPAARSLGDLSFYDLVPTKDWTHLGPPTGRRDWRVDPSQCQVAAGPVQSTLRTAGAIGPHRLVRETRLAAGSRRIEFTVEIDAKPDSGVLAMRFPLGMSGSAVAGIPFGVESRDLLDREPFRNESFCVGFPEGYFGTRWTDVSSAQQGYTLIAPPGVHTGYGWKKAERSLEMLLHRVRPMPEDEFRQCPASIQGLGLHRYTCALVPHRGDWREAASHREALTQHVPPVVYSPAYRLGRAGVFSGPADRVRPHAVLFGIVQPDDIAKPPVKSAPSLSLVEVQPAQVVLSSMRPVEGGGKRQYEMRLYETTGRATEATITLARPVAHARRTNFLGAPATDAESPTVDGRTIRLTLGPWKIVNLRIELAAP